MRPLAAAFASIFAVSLPGTALPEGATKLLDCDITRVCDAAGLCEPASGHVAFRMQPTELEAAGAGHYTLDYGDVEAEMQAMSDLGPFLWTVGTQRHALIVSSATQWLWHELDVDPQPEATIRFLACSFQQ